MRVDFCCYRFGDAYEAGTVTHEEMWTVSGNGDIVLDDIQFCPFCGTALDDCISDEESDE